VSLTLYVNRKDWLEHLVKMEHRFPDYLPVIKGNGYGFGNESLADAAKTVGKTRIAVGTVEEARELEDTHSFDQMIILTPVLSALDYSDLESNRVFTVGSQAHLQHLLTQFEHLIRQQGNVWAKSDDPIPVRVLVKCQSSMKRYGFSPLEWEKTRGWLDECNRKGRFRFEVQGFSIHFPKEGMGRAEKDREIEEWLKVIQKDGTQVFYVSHLSSDHYLELRDRHSDVQFVMRLGTDLWLHDKSFFEIRSRVLDIKPVRKGERFGYKQRPARQSGYLVYVSGGTANGVGLEAPTIVKGLRGWFKSTAFWLFGLMNRHLSPFLYKGKRLWFAEPPHMQTSVLFFSSKDSLPAIGEEVSIQMRMTTASFDRYVETGSEPAETTGSEVETSATKEQDDVKEKPVGALLQS
jgi:alanine racemase